MARRTGVSGPFKHGRKWRVVTQAGGARTVRSYETEADAREFIDEWRSLLDGKTVAMRLDEWLELVKARGRPPITIATLRNAVLRLVPHLPAKFDDVTARTAAKAYAALVATGCAVDTHRNSLNVARSLWTELTGKGRPTPWDAVTGVGRRRRGKAQLTIDESRRFLSAALELGETEPGGTAAALCLTLALRAGEVVALEGRDVDDGGRVLWVQRGKTVNARRVLEVPEVLRPALLDLATEAGDAGRLFPFSRGWVGYWVGLGVAPMNSRLVETSPLRNAAIWWRDLVIGRRPHRD